MRSDWFEEVDGALEEVGVAEDTFRTWNQLAWRGAPIELPPIDDFPAIGYLRAAEIGAVAGELSKVESLDGEHDDEVRYVGFLSEERRRVHVEDRRFAITEPGVDQPLDAGTRPGFERH